MTAGFKRLQACIGLAGLAILLPPLAWARTSMLLLPEDPGNASQQALMLGRETEVIGAHPIAAADESSGAEAEKTPAIHMVRETELIAARILARDDDPREGEGEEKLRIRPAIRPEEGFQSGTWHLGVKTGYAKSHKIFAGRAPNVQFAPLFLQIGYTVTDVHGPFPVRGSLEVIFEPTFLITAEPKKTFGEGVNPPSPLQFRDRHSVGPVL